MEKVLELTKKYKEFLLYGIFGALTTLVNIVVYFIFTKELGVNFLISNVIAWILSVLFAYVTNKIFVFESKNLSIKEVLKEAVSFFSARLFTGALDMLVMYISVDLLSIDDFLMKILSNIIVILLNYFLSKYWIFKKVEDK